MIRPRSAILCIFIAALLGVAGLLFGYVRSQHTSQDITSPPQTSTSSPLFQHPSTTRETNLQWQIYRSESYGFSVQYPPNFFVKEFDWGKSVGFFDQKNKEVASWWIDIRGKPESQSLTDYLIRQEKLPQESLNDTAAQTTISGFPAFKLPGEGLSQERIFVTTPRLIYHIQRFTSTNNEQFQEFLASLVLF